MVDVIATRMFDTFSRFSPADNYQTDSLASIASLQRFSRDAKFKRILSREAEQKVRESQLFDIKENVPEVRIPKRRPFMGLSCQDCSLSNKESFINRPAERQALINILDFTPTQTTNDFLHRTFSHLFQVYKLKKFPYPQVADRVLKDERLKLAIEKSALQQYRESDRDDDEFYQLLVKKNFARAKKLVFDMRSTLSDFLLRFTSWVLYKLLPCFLSSVVAHPGHIEMLKDASKSDLPLIFLPLHKSHLDYILISFILLNNNIRCPLVAAGDNLKIPFFGSLLRGLGAFFIRRRMDPVQGRKDLIYKAVLHTYMNECLRAGHNIEFFLEGGRTRTGKPCTPKCGVLSVIVESLMDGTIEDALLVPVSVNYERLVDGSFVREQLGQPKQMETFGAAIKGIWKVLNSDYGMMRIDFNQPFSLKELVKTFDVSPKNGYVTKVLKSSMSTSSLYGTDVVSEEHKAVVEKISKHIIYDCSMSTSVMCTNALAFLLLHKFRNGATIAQFSAALDKLREDLMLVKKDVGFTGDSYDVINYAVTMLGPGMVTRQRIDNEEVLKPVAVLPNVIELAYYSNMLATHYALDSIVGMALSMLHNKSTVSQQELVDSVIELCDILQYEFIFHKPCQELDQTVKERLDEFGSRRNVIYKKETDTYLAQRSRKLARHVENEIEDDEEMVPEVMYELWQKEESLSHIKYLRGIIMPFIEAYSATASSLHRLVNTSLLESDLVRSVLEDMKKGLSEGSLFYEESVSVDAVKNALKLFQKWDVLECHTQDRLKLCYLKESYDNDESVKHICQRITKYRQVQIS